MVKVDIKIIDFLKTQEYVTIGFSLGKDSLACALLLKHFNIKFYPFYFTLHPDLAFIKKQVTIYEEYFGQKIIVLPHPMLYDHIRHQDWQPRERAYELSEYDIPAFSFKELSNLWMEENNLSKDCWDVVGMRSSDSFNRRLHIKKEGSLYYKKKKAYLIHDYSKNDCFDLIKHFNCPITDDYKIWGRSWDGYSFRFLTSLKKYYPEDFQKILDYFPLIEAEILRYEFNKKYLG